MSDKIHFTDGLKPSSQIGAALECLEVTIDERRGVGEASYTYRLLEGPLDTALKKLMEEAGEVALAAKDIEAAEVPSRDALIDHLRYEAGDVIYHLMVVLARYGVSVDELAAEMNTRMAEDAIALREGVALLDQEHIKRGK